MDKLNDKLNNNIFFCLNEKQDYTNNSNSNDDNGNNNDNYNDDIKKMMDEFSKLSEEETKIEIQKDDQFLEQWLYEDNNSNHFNDEFFYEKEYTIKDLLKICSYYGIDKNIKMLKCKKQDIIATIVYFESLPENIFIVQRRITMWKYINELLNDPKMKKFIIWN